jgi:hypothetical protein
MGQIIKDQKDTNRKISYEDISSNLEIDLIWSIILNTKKRKPMM